VDCAINSKHQHHKGMCGMIIKIYSPKCIMSMYRIHSFIVLFFAVLVILKVQVHLYRSNNYWLCGVCINFGSSWVIDRLLLQVLGFGTVFVRTYVLRRAILAFQNSKGILKKTFVFVRLQRFVTCFFCVCRVADVPHEYTN